MLVPLMHALDGIETIAFDVPGTGSSPPSPEPLRLRGLAELVAMLVAMLGYRQIDVLGVSWGGLLAQQLANPRRWHDLAYLEQIAPQIYGGAFRADPTLVRDMFRESQQPSFFGYYSRIFAAMGWSSLAWLHRLPQPTLVLAGTEDPLVPVPNAHVLAERIPRAKLHLFQDGHLFLMTRLDEVAPLLRAFLTDPD
jgi:poly(3-hydroxyoctanoate) depolymerase